MLKAPEARSLQPFRSPAGNVQPTQVTNGGDQHPTILVVCVSVAFKKVGVFSPNLQPGYFPGFFSCWFSGVFDFGVFH